MSETRALCTFPGKGTVMSKESWVKQVLEQGTSWGAAILLIAVGILEVLQSISVIFADEMIVTDIEYTYQFDLIVWGWTHLVLGVIGIVTGIALFADATWARPGVLVSAVCRSSSISFGCRTTRRGR